MTILQAMVTAIERRHEFVDVIGAAVDGDAARQAVMTRFALRRISEEADGFVASWTSDR